MNNKIAIDETMTKMADATRLRTRQLLRFSEGYETLQSFMLLLIWGVFLSLELSDKWALVVGSACVVLSIVGIVIFTSIRKKQLLLTPAEAYRRLNERRDRFIIAFIIFSTIGIYMLEKIAPVFYKNYVSNNNILFIVFMFVIFNFYSFLETHLPEYLIASIVCLGISVASVIWSFHVNVLVAVFIVAFIQMLLGSILWIRWRRAIRQISDENREEKTI